jgi:hypothetical protein
VLYGYPSVLSRLARAQLDGRLNLRLLSVSCSGQTMRPDLRAVMAEAWGGPQTNVLGSTEAVQMLPAHRHLDHQRPRARRPARRGGPRSM